MDITKIGLVGYGEVGQALAEGLLSNRQLSVEVFDIRFNADKIPDSLTTNAKARGLILENDIDFLVKNNELIISAVTCEQALQVAERVSENLINGKIFVDMNTVAPKIKMEIDRLTGKKGGIFIEIAILGTIASYGFKSPMLACGKHAKNFVRFFNKLGFKITFLSDEIGQASKMKMLRSVFAKGVESLLFEMLVAAEKYNMLEPLMDAVVEHMDKSSFLNIAQTWITTNAVHAKRRAEEMDHVIQTLKDINVQPIMSTAARDRLQKCARINLFEHVRPEHLSDYRSVIKSMVKLNYT
jgi:3-hydroxyisobutyrate dehydrogenase-like beta-hydroxyacid dehydrogenase